MRSAYAAWHESLKHLPKVSRYSLGKKVDILFTDTIEIILYAAYARRADKLAILQKACVKLDALQFFLQLAWELNVLDNRKYGAISTPLAEVGKMLGGWKKQFTKDAPNKPGAPRA